MSRLEIYQVALSSINAEMEQTDSSTPQFSALTIEKMALMSLLASATLLQVDAPKQETKEEVLNTATYLH